MVILSKLRNTLTNKGVFLSKVTADEDLAQFFRDVRPVAVGKELIRIGRAGDGGYLTPDDLDGVEVCFSPGVADTASFEDELSKRGIQSYLADYSVEKAPIENDMVSFEKKFLGDKDNEKYMRLETWVQTKACDNDRDLMLQMDIEGAEFQVILDTPRTLLRRFRIIIVEFHNMEKLFDRDGFPFVRQAFEKLLGDFTVCHIHPNNVDPVWSNGRYVVPRTIEFTFLRKDRADVTDQTLSFPHTLDAPNVPELKDIALPNCWWRDV